MTSNPFEDPEAGVETDSVTQPLTPNKPQSNPTTDTTTASTTTNTTTYGSAAGHNPPPETPDCCVQLFMWFPLRIFGLFGGIGLIVAIIVDWVLFDTSFLYKITACYLFIFGIIIVFIEAPAFVLTRQPQLIIFYWFRILSRMWGRSFFYIFASILTYGELEHKNFTLASIVGMYLLVIAIIMLYISHSSASKYRRMFLFVAQGCDTENKEEITNRLVSKFDELDSDKDGEIGVDEVIKLGMQAGRVLSNAQRHAIQTFLDVGCNGVVIRDDFVNQYLNYNIKQTWL